MATKNAPTKTADAKPKRKIDFSGVPGELVDAPNIALNFGYKTRMSPYDALLEKLDAAGEGKLLRFGDVKARVSVIARAKKLGLKVMCAEHEGVLYVKHAGYPADSERAKAAMRSKIRALLNGATANVIEVTRHLRDSGLVDVDAGIVGPVLEQMLRAGELNEHATVGTGKKYSLRKAA